MKKLMVLDGNSIVNRAFYGVSQNLTTRDGQPTNAVFGFLAILNKLLDECEPQALCVTFDRKAPPFRHLAYEGYKCQNCRYNTDPRRRGIALHIPETFLPYFFRRAQKDF